MAGFSVQVVKQTGQPVLGGRAPVIAFEDDLVEITPADFNKASLVNNRLTPSSQFEENISPKFVV